MSDPRLDLPQRTSADTEGEVKRVLGKLEASGNNLKILRILANAKNAFRPFVLLSNSLMALAELPAADREVVILHLAARRGVPYEWKEHVSMSAAAGITNEQREILATGKLDELDSFTDAQRLALRAATEIMEDRGLSEATFAEVVNQWGKEQAMELILTVAWWGAFVPTVIEAIGLQDPK